MQGLSAQNRAVEGDEVALQILPPSQWFISGPLLQAAASARAASAAAAANAVVPVSAVGVCALEEEAALLGPGDALQEALSGSVLEASDNPAAAADDEADSGAPDQAEATCEAGGGREAPDQAVEAKRAKRREEKKAFKRRSLPPPPPPSPGQDLIGAARAQLEARFGNSDAAPWDAAGSPQAALAIVAALYALWPHLAASRNPLCAWLWDIRICPAQQEVPRMSIVVKRASLVHAWISVCMHAVLGDLIRRLCWLHAQAVRAPGAARDGQGGRHPGALAAARAGRGRA